VYDCVESIVVISRVVHSADCAIGLHQAVRPLNHVTISGLPLALLVSCVRVVHSVVESVARICLEERDAYGYLYVVGFSYVLMCRKCGQKEESPYHILSHTGQLSLAIE
jgi:hypothetical protein